MNKQVQIVVMDIDYIHILGSIKPNLLNLTLDLTLYEFLFSNFNFGIFFSLKFENQYKL